MKVALEYLRPSQLTVDHSYQRDIDNGYVAKLVENWDPEQLGVLVGNRRNGVVALTEGQHRRAALIAMGKDDPVPVLITEKASFEHEAKQFLAENNKKTVAFAYKHRAKLAIKDPEAVKIQKLLDKYGLTIDPQSDGVRIVAASTVYKVARKCGAAALDNTLGILREAFGPLPDSFAAHLLLGVGITLTSNSAPVDTARMIKVLQRKDPDQWKIEARTPDNGSPNDNLGICTARALRKAYNRGLSSSRMI